MTLVDEQFHELSKRFPAASCTNNPDGSFSVVVPDVPLPEGWTANTATVRFILPVGFPMARPDCFWADPELKLAGNRVPKNTGPNAMPHGPSPLLWFSWHVKHWSPNSDTLLTYMRVINDRFKELQ